MRCLIAKLEEVNGEYDVIGIYEDSDSEEYNSEEYLLESFFFNTKEGVYNFLMGFAIEAENDKENNPCVYRHFCGTTITKVTVLI